MALWEEFNTTLVSQAAWAQRWGPLEETKDSRQPNGFTHTSAG